MHDQSGTFRRASCTRKRRRRFALPAQSKIAPARSSLDPLLNLYDAQGHVLATSDDAGGPDARIAAVLPRDGGYFFAINDAHDRGGATYSYVVEIRGE